MVGVTRLIVTNTVAGRTSWDQLQWSRWCSNIYGYVVIFWESVYVYFMNLWLYIHRPLNLPVYTARSCSSTANDLRAYDWCCQFRTTSQYQHMKGLFRYIQVVLAVAFFVVVIGKWLAGNTPPRKALASEIDWACAMVTSCDISVVGLLNGRRGILMYHSSKYPN